MARLGEESPEAGQAHATPFAPRCVKDSLAEALFARQRGLLTDPSVVFMDTTSLSFEGAGGAAPGTKGCSEHHRADLGQPILAVVVDGDGRPICSEMAPGNAADVAVLIAAADRRRHRLDIGRVGVVADRSLIAGPTRTALEARGLEDVLGGARAGPRRPGAPGGRERHGRLRHRDRGAALGRDLELLAHPLRAHAGAEGTARGGGLLFPLSAA